MLTRGHFRALLAISVLFVVATAVAIVALHRRSAKEVARHLNSKTPGAGNWSDYTPLSATHEPSPARGDKGRSWTELILSIDVYVLIATWVALVVTVLGFAYVPAVRGWLLCGAVLSIVAMAAVAVKARFDLAPGDIHLVESNIEQAIIANRFVDLIGLSAIYAAFCVVMVSHALSKPN